MGTDSWNGEIVEFSVEALLECGNQWSTSQESGEEGSALQYRTLPYLSTLNFAGSNPAFLHIYPRLLVFFFTPWSPQIFFPWCCCFDLHTQGDRAAPKAPQRTCVNLAPPCPLLQQLGTGRPTPSASLSAPTHTLMFIIERLRLPSLSLSVCLSLSSIRMMHKGDIHCLLCMHLDLVAPWWLLWLCWWSWVSGKRAHVNRR